MLEKNNKLAIEQLKTYLYSLEIEKEEAQEKKIGAYKAKCEENKKKINKKEIQKIKDTIKKEYGTKIKTKDEIVNLLEECSQIPEKKEQLEISKYMLHRADIKIAENIVIKTIKKIEKRYNQIIDKIEEKLDEFPVFDYVEEIDFSIYKIQEKRLEKVKENYKEKYNDEEKQELIQKEIDIINKAKIFNTTPIPHEILKESDKDIQSKMQKFNNIRQKRLKIIETMENDYKNLQKPREKSAMVNDATINIKNIEEIVTKSEYSKIKNAILKKKKKIDKSTSELRTIIKTKEKKTGIANYNIQEARYGRMGVLRNIISESTKIIETHTLVGAEEQLEKLKKSYEKEKQFAAVIEKLDEDVGNTVQANTEVKAYEQEIKNLENKIKNSNQIIKEQEEKIKKAKKELIILWKMEIDGTISKKKDVILEIPETTQNIENVEKQNNEKNKKFFFKFKKIQNGKHACV